MADDPKESNNQESTPPPPPVEPTFPVDQYITESAEIVLPNDSKDFGIL